MPRKKLGEILLSAGVITPEQLNRALAEQSRWNAPLGRILVDLGMLTEEKLLEVLSYQLNLPIADLDGMEISEHVLSLVPAQFCQENGVLPFREDPSGRFLDVAMVEPMNLDVVETLRVVTNHNIRTYFATYSAMARAMIKYHGLALKTGEGPAPVLASGLDAREISPSGYHLATAAGAPIRELGPQTLETDARRQIRRDEAGTQESLSGKLAGLERQVFELGRKLEAMERDGADGNRLEQFSRSIKALASAVKELKNQTMKNEEHLTAIKRRMDEAEALQERDERVLKKILGLLVNKGLATSEELRRLLERA